MSIRESLRAMFANALLVRQEDEVETAIQVGRTVTIAPCYMRTQLWLGVLQRYPGLGNKAARQFNSLLQKQVPELTAEDIAKDVGRTFPNIARFTTLSGKAGIQRVLLAYAAYDPEVNYCQGMNFLAALLLIWMPSEAEAFGGLVVLMQERGLRELYKTDMASLQARLWQIGKLLPPDLAEHLEQNSVLPVLYASSWLLTAFSADFPLFWSSRVMDVILTDGYIEPMMKVVLGILKTCKPYLMKGHDMEAMVQYIKVGVPRWRHVVLQEVLTDSLAMDWTSAQAALLRQTEGVESVVEAVRRTTAANQERSQVAGNEASSECAEGREQPNTSQSARSTGFAWADRMSGASLRLNPPSKPLRSISMATPAKGTLPSTPTLAKPPAARKASLPRSVSDSRATPSVRAPEPASPQPQASGHLLDDAPISPFSAGLAGPADASVEDLRSWASASAQAPRHSDSEGGHMRQPSLAERRSSTGSFGEFTGSTSQFEEAGGCSARTASIPEEDYGESQWYSAGSLQLPETDRIKSIAGGVSQDEQCKEHWDDGGGGPHLEAVEAAAPAAPRASLSLLDDEDDLSGLPLDVGALGSSGGALDIHSLEYLESQEGGLGLRYKGQESHTAPVNGCLAVPEVLEDGLNGAKSAANVDDRLQEELSNFRISYSSDLSKPMGKAASCRPSGPGGGA